MSKYYNGKRSPRGLFNPNSKEPFTLSRTKLDLFVNCPRCFYIDQRLGVGQPPGYPFSLNSAVDVLLKKEFDIHRANHSAHPLMETYGIEAVPFENEHMEEWRDSLRRGVKFLHEPTNFILRGGIDDVWVNPKGELHVVDYKATSKNGEVGIDAEWQGGYKRQIEVYQWLFRKNGFEVSNIGYFVYANGRTDAAAFDKKLEFDIKIIPYEGNAAWIEDALVKARRTLESDMLPEANMECDYCLYRKSVQDALGPFQKKE